MAQKPETKFRKRVTEFLDSLPNAWFESIQQCAIRGTPDKLGCIGKYFVAIEIKSEGGESTPLQKYKLGLIKNTGSLAFVVDPNNFDEMKDFLSNFAKKASKNHQKRGVK